MLNSNPKDAEDLRIYQIIDANLDRAREGLRVLEDWARFGLGKGRYVERIKNFRQILGKNHLEVYKQSRNYIDDKCKGFTHQEQFNRKNSEGIISIFFNLMRKLIYILKLDLRSKLFNWFYR